MKIFKCNGNKDVISAKVSDHHPLIHHTHLFWNIWMRGKLTSYGDYNNGFSKIETEEEYMTRLKKCAEVINEIIQSCPMIKTISLCEGPVETKHVLTFFNHLNKFTSMHRFNIAKKINKLNSKNKIDDWGLWLLTDKGFKVELIDYDFKQFGDSKEIQSINDKLLNRLMIWKLSTDTKNSFIALAHFPYAPDASVTQKCKLSTVTNYYRKIVSFTLAQYQQDSFIFAGDFNFNPYFITQTKHRIYDYIPAHNSILLQSNKDHKLPKLTTVTVDGILLSKKEKQIYLLTIPCSNLSATLLQENRLMSFYTNNYFFKTNKKAANDSVIVDTKGSVTQRLESKKRAN